MGVDHLTTYDLPSLTVVAAHLQWILDPEPSPPQLLPNLPPRLHIPQMKLHQTEMSHHQAGMSHHNAGMSHHDV